jgi:hypothetical protein
MSLGGARLLKLSESIQVEDCLRAIIAYHKSVYGMRDELKMFLYLGINQLVFGPGGGLSEHSKACPSSWLYFHAAGWQERVMVYTMKPTVVGGEELTPAGVRQIAKRRWKCSMSARITPGL